MTGPQGMGPLNPMVSTHWGDSAYDTLLKTTMTGTMFYAKLNGKTPSGSDFLLEEEMINADLLIPAANDYFDIGTGEMPNSDSCLVVRGDLSQAYKAYVAAPTLSPVDIFNVGDVAANNDWSMSCWFRVTDLASTVSPEVILLGCTTAASTALFGNTRNQGQILALGQAAVNAFKIAREPLNNVASPNSQKTLDTTATIQSMQNERWFLLTINVSGISGGQIAMEVYIDTFHTTITNDTAGAADVFGSGGYDSGRFLHLGAYHSGGNGRPAVWRIGKWAFHDHQLTQAERKTMWQTMRGASHVYTDDFNRASVDAKLWQSINGTGSITLTSNQMTSVGVGQRAVSNMLDHGNPDMYAQILVNALGDLAMPIVRVRPYSTAAITDSYRGGWNVTTGQWEMYRGSNSVGTPVAGGGPTAPYTCRIEARTVSGNVDLVLKANGVTKMTHTDSSGNKNLIHTCAGVLLKGISGQDPLVDNFESGTL